MTNSICFNLPYHMGWYAVQEAHFKVYDDGLYNIENYLNNSFSRKANISPLISVFREES